MKTAGVRELRNNLSAYLREVRAGETVLVTEHGRVVAEIVPPGRPTARLSPEELRYREAVERGLIQPPTRPGDKSWLRGPGAGLPRGTAARLLDAEREES